VIKRAIRSLINRRGYDLVPLARDWELEEHFLRLYERCAPFTMTSRERMFALYQATRYVDQRELPGAIVECGVWRGGSMMLSALVTKRPIFLFDTFSGMPEPTERDYRLRDRLRARDRWKEGEWAAAGLDEVRRNLATTDHPALHFVPGRVEDTVPDQAPDEIALLRLDTDWYESSLHELEHLYPRLVDGGILILDDYGHWSGARQAVDEYFAKDPVLLNRIDYAGRLVVKAP
jgi:O-methyltransferase